MSHLERTNIFVHSKNQSYDSLDENSLIIIFPRLYFTTENPEDIIIKRLKNSPSLVQAFDLLNLADELAFIDFSCIWNDVSADITKK